MGKYWNTQAKPKKFSSRKKRPSLIDFDFKKASFGTLVWVKYNPDFKKYSKSQYGVVLRKKDSMVLIYNEKSKYFCWFYKEGGYYGNPGVAQLYFVRGDS